MKQTNNAIKFLMAQYRAIFKSAYIKGLATAVVLTSALAAGQANAAKGDSTLDQDDINANLSSAFTITNTSTDKGPTSFEKVVITEGVSGFTGSITVNDTPENSAPNDNAINLSGSSFTGTGSLTVAAASGKDEATAKKKGMSISATDSGSSVNLGKINVTSGMLALSAETAATSELTVTAKEINLGAANSNDYAFIRLGVDSTSGSVTLGNIATTTTAGSKMTIDGKNTQLLVSGPVTSGKETILAADTVTMNDGSVYFLYDSSSTPSGTASIKSHEFTMNGGLFEVQSGASVNINLTARTALDSEGKALKSGDEIVGSMTINKGTLNFNGAGTLTVQNGTLTIGDDAVISSEKRDSNTGAGTLAVDGSSAKESATLKLSSTKLESFLTADTTDKNKVTVKSGTLAFSDADQVELTTFNDLLSGSQLTFDSGSVVSGNNLAVSNKLESATELTINANTLTLGGGETFNSSTTGLNFKEAKAKNVVFKNDTATASAGATFTLQNTLTLKNTRSITDGNGNELVAGESGSIAGDVIVQGAINVDGGFYNANKITLSGGTVTAQMTDTGVADGIQSSLTIGELALTSGNGTVTTSGSHSQIVIEDISGITATSKATIQADHNGTIKLNASDVQDILDLAAENSGSQNIKVLADNNGTVEVDGDLTMDFTDNNKTNLQEVLKLQETGTLKANSLTIKGHDLSDSQKGYMAVGTVEVNELTLNATKAGSSDQNETLYLGTGTYKVDSRLSSPNKGIVVWGENDSNKQGIVELGHVVPVLDDNDNTIYHTASSTGGTVDVKNLTVSQNGVLSVGTGSWTGNDFALESGGTLTIGNGASVTDINGNAITASLNGAKLNIVSGTATVNTTGTGTFDELAMAAGTLTVNGAMTINGKYTAADANANPSVSESFGVALTGGAINVSGRDAQLTFGQDAVKAITVSGDTVTLADGTFTNNITVDNFATLKLDFAGGEFTTKALQDLRKQLLANAADGLALDDGYIDLGAGKIAGITVSDEGTVDWDSLSEVKDITDIKNNDLSNATLINVDGNTIVSANVGNIMADGNTQTVSLGDTVLSNANGGKGQGNFIFNANDPKTAINTNITAGAHVTLENGGNIGNLSLTKGNGEGNNQTILNVIASGDQVTNIKKISAADQTLININGITNVAESITADNLNVDNVLTVANAVSLKGDLTSSDKVNTGAIKAASLKVTGYTDYSGNLDISGKSTFEQSAILGGNNKFADTVTFKDYAEFANGVTEAKDIVVTTADELGILDNADVTAQTITLQNGGTVYVGNEAGSEGNEKWDSSAGYLTVGRLDLNGGTLMTDPDYSKAASIVAVGSMGASGDYTTVKGNEAGILDGQAIALRNSILAIGVTDTESTRAQDELKATFASYFNDNGALQRDKVGAVAYVAKALDVDNGSKIIVDADKSFSTYEQALSTSAYGDKISGNDIYLGENSVLAVSDKAALNSYADNTQRAAINFTTANHEASIYVEPNAKVVLTGKGFSTRDEIMLFNDAANDGIMVNGNNLTVETMNGLLYFTLAKGEEHIGGKLGLNYKAIDSAFSQASDPVKYTLISYAADNNNWEDSKAAVDNLHGADVTAHVGYDGNGNYFYKNSDDTTTPVEDNNAFTFREVKDNDGKSTYRVYEVADNYFLDEVVRNSTTGIEAETAARLGVFGGSVQAAMTAGSATTDAIAGRFGMGAQAAGMTYADNGQGAGLWVTPIYRNADSDGFAAQGADYGTDLNLYGVALGGDYTLANGLRVGAMFNIGSGDADGQGAGSLATNDFDYYGFAAFAGYTMGQFTVVGDISYTTVDNEVTANTAVDKIGANFDTSNLSIGVTGQYALNFNGTQVTPHAGLRFSSIDMDDYTVDGKDVVAAYNGDTMNVFSIPVGVTIAKEFEGETWTVKPSFDLTLTGQFGDDEAEGTVEWAGIDNLHTNVTSEVFDNFTYGATVGVAARTGNFSLGFGLNYTGSSNVDEFGVNANARYVF